MANDKSKTKAQLIAELEEMRQQRAVEKATERVREAVLAMRRDEDLLQVAITMYREMERLGVESPGVSFQLIGEESYRFWQCSVGKNSRRYGISLTGWVEIDEELVARPYRERPISLLPSDFLDRWRAGQVWTDEWTEQLDLPGLYSGPGWMITNVPFAHGTVGFREPTYSEEHVGIVQVLTQALSLGHLRFLAFQKVEEQAQSLEAQNRQLTIERSLEQIRAEVASMQKGVTGLPLS